MATGIDVGSFIGSDFKGDDAIRKIMEAQEKTKNPILNDKFRLQMQKQAWNGLQKKLSDLATIGRDVFSPVYSSFRKIQTTSSSPDLLSISSAGIDTSKWDPATYSMTPKQMAMEDSFKSDPQDSDSKLPAASFSILSNGKSYPINFKGGSLSSLADTINQVASEVLTASIIEGDDGEYLSIQGKGLGKKSAIDFSGNTDFLKSLGLVRPASPSYYDVQILDPQGLSGSRQAQELLSSGSLLLRKGESATKQLSSVQNIETGDGQLWIYLKNTPTKSAPVSKQDNSLEDSEEAPISGLRDKIWVGDTELMGEPLYNPNWFLSPTPIIPSSIAPSKDQGTVSLSLIYEDGRTLTASIPWNLNSEEIQILKSGAPRGKITSIRVRNNGPGAISLTKGQLVTLNKGKWEHKNSITKAQNAIISYKGVDYERDSNTITDIVPGTLQIGGESTKPVSLSVNYDTDAIIEQLKQWIITYNNAMDFIRNITERDVSAISRLNRDRNSEISEKREAYEKMTNDEKQKMGSDGTLFAGFLAGDSSVDMIRTKLRDLTRKPYTTDLKEKLMFLEQLGIAVPNAAQLTTMSDEEREAYRAGYLDFPKEGQDKFLALLKQFPKSVQQFFYQRTGDSKLYNEGMMPTYNDLLTLYLQRYNGKLPGFFPAKTQLLDSQMQTRDRRLSEIDDKMKRDETKLRRDFSKVYEAQGRAKAMESQLNNRFGRGNN